MFQTFPWDGSTRVWTGHLVGPESVRWRRTWGGTVIQCPFPGKSFELGEREVWGSRYGVKTGDT